MSEKTDTAAIPIGESLRPDAPVLSPLDQIRQRHARITPGAWHWHLSQGRPQELIADHGTYSETVLEVAYDDQLLLQDADFIASAPADIDTLLALLEESEAMNKTLEATLKVLEESYRALRGDYELLSEQLDHFDRYRVGVGVPA